LADLSDIQLALKNYQVGHNGTYPSLMAGSYLAGKSVSVWPSWRATLGAALGITMPLDPVNKLGDCSSPAGYDPATCWNQTAKQFAGNVAADGGLVLPTGSHAYVYTVKSDGPSYNICAVMETTYTLTNLTISDQVICLGP